MKHVVRMLSSFGRADLHNIRRDAFLAWIILIPIVFALIIRLGVPVAAAIVQERLAFDIRSYYPLVMSLFLLITPSLIGMIIGFLLLDERDEHVLTALLVTPLPLKIYILYRLTLPIVIGLLATLIGYPIAGLVPLESGDFVAISILGSLTAPMFSLFLAAFSENKVVGLATFKIINGLSMGPMIAFFIPLPWQWLIGIIPTYWPLRTFWSASQGESIVIPLLIGILYHVLIVWLLFHRFRQVLYS